MNLQYFVNQAFREPPSEAIIRNVAVELQTSVGALFEALATDVATNYLGGTYSWEFGDRVMNNIYSSAYVHSDLCLPTFAWKVFEAFDEGKYVHDEGPPEMDGEPRTKAILLETERRGPRVGA